MEFQEETFEEDMPSTDAIHLSSKSRHFKMTRLAREKFPQRKVGDTVKVRVPDVDRGRCDSRNILG